MSDKSNRFRSSLRAIIVASRRANERGENPRENGGQRGRGRGGRKKDGVEKE